MRIILFENLKLILIFIDNIIIGILNTIYTSI